MLLQETLFGFLLSIGRVACGPDPIGIAKDKEFRLQFAQLLFAKGRPGLADVILPGKRLATVE